MLRKTKVKRPGSPVLFAICMVTVLGIGAADDYNSCLRGQGVRAALNEGSQYFRQTVDRNYQRTQVDKGAALVIDFQGVASAYKAMRESEVHQLDCSFPFPSTH